jgi:adenosylcobinamide kinase/adenosylcobinamide-phosphate guanylyltransferase
VLTLVLGGTRSGKSTYAEWLAAEAAASSRLPVRYVATARSDPDDPAYLARIEAHRARRPDSWATIECASPADLPELLHCGEVVLMDSVGAWMVRHPDFRVDLPALDAALDARGAPTVLVSEEVGWSVHPPTSLGRRYVDALGELNQHLAARADRAVLVVAGRVLELGPGLRGRGPGA